MLAAVTGRYQASLLRLPVPEEFDTAFDAYHSTPIPVGDHALNLSRSADPEVDRLLEEQRATPDDAVRAALAGPLIRRLNAVVPSVWLYAEPELMVVGPRVRAADGLLRARRPPETPWAGEVALAN
jgi:hypothetical protein